MSSTTVPNAFMQQFVVNAPNGGVDLKKSIKAFSDAFEDWIKEQADIKPAILQELQDHDRLGEGKLVNFVMHRLRLKPTKENEDRITSALEDLARTNRIHYKTTESGRRRGRGAGYVLGQEQSMRPSAVS